MFVSITPIEICDIFTFEAMILHPIKDIVNFFSIGSGVVFGTILHEFAVLRVSGEREETGNNR